VTPRGRRLAIVIAAFATSSGTTAVAQAPPVTEAKAAAASYFAGRNVAVGDCAPAPMLGPQKPCIERKGSAKFLFTQDLAPGLYALEIEYMSDVARPVLLRIDDEPVVRALEAPAAAPRWERVGVYRLSGVFTTVEIESVGGFPAIGALSLSMLEPDGATATAGR
jgi:hypothetical protein